MVSRNLNCYSIHWLNNSTQADRTSINVKNMSMVMVHHFYTVNYKVHQIRMHHFLFCQRKIVALSQPHSVFAQYRVCINLMCGSKNETWSIFMSPNLYVWQLLLTPLQVYDIKNTSCLPWSWISAVFYRMP